MGFSQFGVWREECGVARERNTNEQKNRAWGIVNRENQMKRMYKKNFNAEAQRRKDAENAVFSYCAFSVFEISAPPRLCASALKFHIT